MSEEGQTFSRRRPPESSPEISHGIFLASNWRQKNPTTFTTTGCFKMGNCLCQALKGTRIHRARNFPDRGICRDRVSSPEGVNAANCPGFLLKKGEPHVGQHIRDIRSIAGKALGNPEDRINSGKSPPAVIVFKDTYCRRLCRPAKVAPSRSSIRLFLPSYFELRNNSTAW